LPGRGGEIRVSNYREKEGDLERKSLGRGERSQRRERENPERKRERER